MDVLHDSWRPEQSKISLFLNALLLMMKQVDCKVSKLNVSTEASSKTINAQRSERIFFNSIYICSEREKETRGKGAITKAKGPMGQTRPTKEGVPVALCRTCYSMQYPVPYCRSCSMP